MGKNTAELRSLAVKMPSQYYTNDMSPYADIKNMPVYWWRLWGMEGRYLMNRALGETVETMGLGASEEALRLAGKRAEDIDLILATTCCISGWSADADRIFPGLAQQLKKSLGCKPSCVALEVNQACISFLISLQIAADYIRAGVYRNVLICVSESFSTQMDFMDTSSTLFADGSAAAVVSAGTNGSDLLSSAYISDSTHCDLATIEWRYPNKPIEQCQPGDLRSYFTLKAGAPQKMQTFVPFKVPQVVNQALDKLALATKDIDYFIFHQPSQLLINTWADGLAVDKERFLVTVDRYSCLASVSIPVTLYEAVRQKKLAAGNRVVFAGASTGWGFCAQVWDLHQISINQ